jgi:hypothetical protein
VVQEILGHSSVSVTVDVYSHVLPDMQEKAAAAMDDLRSTISASTVGFTSDTTPVNTARMRLRTWEIWVI